jgi:hypothetical protein
MTDCSNCGYCKETENDSVDIHQDKTKDIIMEQSLL